MPGLSTQRTIALVFALVFPLVFPLVFALAAAAFLGVTTPATAQTLDLDGVRAGPSLPAENGALDLAAALEEERAQLEVATRTLRGEALVSAQARMKLRQIAISLLQSGANRPWTESAPVVLGLRAANLLRSADAAIEAAAAGRRLSDGRPLAADDARRALEALRALGAVPLDRLQGSMRRDAANPARIVEVLAQTLAPLATVARLVEETETPDPWPALAEAIATGQAAAATRESLDALRARLAAVKAMRAADSSEGTSGGAAAAQRGVPPVDPALLERLEAVLSRAEADPLLDRTLLHALSSAVRAAEWVASLRSLPLPRPVDESVAARVELEVARALDLLADTPKGSEDAVQSREASLGDRSGALADLAMLGTVIDACDAMLKLREAQGSNDLSRRALSEAVAALVAATERGASSARSASRAAARISEACLAATRLEHGAASEAPREFREVVRALDREARIAVRALADACRELALDPALASDPGALAPLTRVLTLDADRTRIVALHGLTARVGAVRPKALQGVHGATRRLARTLLDPIKRPDAQRGFTAVEGMVEAAFPLPFEDDLLRRTERAMTLTGGEPERVLEVAAQARVAWAEAVGRSDLGGPDAVWLDEVARFFAAMRDLSSIAAPVTRGDADRLALWGGWTARRALVAPATIDLEARAILAARSLVASARSGDRSAFRRDLEVLERAIPLVRLVARLERTVTPLLAGDAATMASMLAPLVHLPRSNAAFVAQWPRLMMLDRALLESEFARRKGVSGMQRDLAAFMSDLARDIEVGAFGAPAAIGAVPGFDGTSADGASERRGADAPAPRRR